MAKGKIRVLMAGWRIYFFLCQFSPGFAERIAGPLLLRVRRWAMGF